MINRRALLTAGVALGALTATCKFGEAGPMTTTEQAIDYRNLSDAEWRKRLNSAQYDVLRKHGTERAGTSPLNKEKRKGTFACAGCDLPLFSSDTKFESGTGWPSFYQPLPDAVGDQDRSRVLHDPHRGALQTLPRPSRPCVRRRPEADRPALLHERRGDEIHPRGRVLVLTHDPEKRTRLQKKSCTNSKTDGKFCRLQAEKIVYAGPLGPAFSYK